MNIILKGWRHEYHKLSPCFVFIKVKMLIKLDEMYDQKLIKIENSECVIENKFGKKKKGVS